MTIQFAYPNPIAAKPERRACVQFTDIRLRQAQKQIRPDVADQLHTTMSPGRQLFK